MKKVLSIGASSSSKSINQQWANYAASQIADAKVEAIDLNDYEMPIYSSDREEANGIPDLAQQFLAKIESSEIVVISFAEHNGTYSAAFKNVLDWASRGKQRLFEGTKVVLLSTSPGSRGGATVLGLATTFFPFMGADVVGSLSLGSFYDHFGEEGLKNEEVQAQLNNILKEL